MYKRISITLLLALLFVIGQTGFCYSGIDTERSVTLNIEYKYDEAAISGAAFKLYKVAEVSENMSYTMTSEFENYSVSLDNLDSRGWADLALTLSGYAARDRINPTDSGSTNSSGIVSFPNGVSTLKTGLYLVVGTSLTKSGYIYTTEPFMLCLPSMDAEGSWEYDVTAIPKAERTRKSGSWSSGSGGSSVWSTNPAATDSPGVVSSPDNPDEPSSSITSVKVLKVWVDDESQRPDSIEIQILRDNEVYNTVELNAQNNWRYTWDSLSSDYTWQIVEKEVPAGYTVSTSNEGITYVVTNTYKTENESQSENSEDTPNSSNSEGGDNDTSESSGGGSSGGTNNNGGGSIPTVPGVPRVTGSTDNNSGSGTAETSAKLPQTGQLMWPIPFMIIMGMMLFVFGWIRHRS